MPVAADCNSLARTEPSGEVVTPAGRQYCNMRERGGGWTLLMKSEAKEDTFACAPSPDCSSSSRPHTPRHMHCPRHQTRHQ